MDFFVLVLVVAFIAGIIGIFEEISQIIGPVLIMAGIITAVSLIIAIINNRRK